MNPLPIDSPCLVNGQPGRVAAVNGTGREYFIRLASGPMITVDAGDVTLAPADPADPLPVLEFPASRYVD